MKTEGKTVVGRGKRKVYGYKALVCEIIKYYLKVICAKGRWIFKSLAKSLKIIHVQQKKQYRGKKEY